MYVYKYLRQAAKELDQRIFGQNVSEYAECVVRIAKELAPEYVSKNTDGKWFDSFYTDKQRNILGTQVMYGATEKFEFAEVIVASAPSLRFEW